MIRSPWRCRQHRQAALDLRALLPLIPFMPPKRCICACENERTSIREVVHDFLARRKPEFETREPALARDEQEGCNLINRHLKMCVQTLRGSGVAFTEIMDHVLGKIPKDRREAVWQAYFGKDDLGCTLGRTHIDSCDFSRGNG